MSRMPKKKYYPPMKPREFVKAQNFYALNGVEFSHLIGVAWRQGQRYRDGESAIPNSVAKLIRTAVRLELAPEEIG